MIKRSRFPKIFFGWWTVIATGVIALWGQGFNAYGISALFKPMSAELGFTRALTSVAVSLERFEGGLEAPLSGWMSDRFGPKWVVIFGIFLVGIGLILMNFIQSLWQYYVVWGVVFGTGANIALALPLDTAISNWFVKKRGLALSIKWVFSGLSGVVALPIIAWMISTQGWRMACLIGGLVMWGVGLPLAWIFLKRHRPEYYGLLPDGATVGDGAAETSQTIDKGVKYAAEVQEVEFSIKQAMSTLSYWLLIAAMAAHGIFGPVLNIHCIPFLTDRGIDPVKAASMMSIYVATSIPARLVCGYFADRIRTSRLTLLLAGAFFLQTLGLVIFLLHPTETMIYVWFVLYGLGYGGAIIIPPIMRGRYFGRKAFGSIGGSVSVFMTPISVAGPIYAGWVYDTTGNYTVAFTLFAGLLALATVIALFIRQPRPPAQITDIRKIV